MSARARTVLLIGGTGFIGTNLARRLEAGGHRVLVAGRTAGERDGRPVPALPLEDTDALLAHVAAERADTVVHLACGLLPSSDAAAYDRERERVSVPTIRLARGLAAAARSGEGTRLVFVSSGGTVYGAPVGALAAEDDACAPISLYGQAKLELEGHLRFLARTAGLRCLVVRPSNPYGPYQPLRGAQGLVSVILGRLADGEPLRVWGDGSAVRDYLYVDDLSDALAGLVEGEADGIVNIGSGQGHSLLDVVDAVEAATGRRPALDFAPARPGDVARIVLDTGRLRSLGLYRARPLAEGVRLYARQLGMARA